MALPTLSYSDWRFDVNQDLNTTGTIQGDYRQLWFTIKQTLTSSSGWTDSSGSSATVSSPWVVVASSNGTTANSSDNWSSTTNLNWGTTGARSWIVLRQTGIDGYNNEILIDLKADNATYYYQAYLYWSPTGFTLSGYSTSTPPTASLQSTLFSGSWYNGNSTFSCALHIQMTDGGEITRIFSHIGGAIRSFWTFEKPKLTISEWINPSITIHPAGASTSTSSPSYGNLNDGSSNVKANINSNIQAIILSSLAYSNNMAGQLVTSVSDFTGAYPLFSIPIVCIQDSAKGVLGVMDDIWFGSVTPSEGDTYASGGNKLFIHIGNVVLPWNLSTPLLS